MPHRVANFFRNSTSSIENQVIHLKKTTIRSRTKSPNRTTTTSGGIINRESRSTERVATYASSIEEEMDESSPSPAADSTTHNTNTPISRHTSPEPVIRRPTDSPRLRPKDAHHDKEKEKEHHHHHHRLSFPTFHLARSNKEAHINPHAALSWKIESPPIMFHGDAENSTGALVSGQLFLDIKDDAGYEIDSFKATLKIHVTQKKPFTAHCTECTNQYTLLKEWTFLSHTGLPLHRGVHPFPFSILLDGHLPATLDTPLVNITYEFKAEAIPANYNNPSVNHNHTNINVAPIRLEKTLDVKRSLPPPELPHHSVRVFPPTNVKASVHYQQVIHPIGTNNLSMRLDGIAKINNPANGAGTLEYWKLKKLTWRLEETIKTVAPACDKHMPVEGTAAAADQQQQGGNNNNKRGMARNETRIIGEKTLFGGWKSSYAGPTDSSIDLELEYALNKHARYSCNLKARDGTEVSHQLMLEMVVSQECAPLGKPSMVTQTGVGRILRMHFATVLTERGGIGISWDNEAPPIYQDVPPSPPAYCGDGAHDDVFGRVENLPDIMESLDGAAVSGPSGRSSGRSSPEGSR